MLSPNLFLLTWYFTSLIIASKLSGWQQQSECSFCVQVISTLYFITCTIEYTFQRQPNVMIIVGGWSLFSTNSVCTLRKEVVDDQSSSLDKSYHTVADVTNPTTNQHRIKSHQALTLHVERPPGVPTFPLSQCLHEILGTVQCERLGMAILWLICNELKRAERVSIKDNNKIVCYYYSNTLRSILPISPLDTLSARQRPFSDIPFGYCYATTI